jgi:hypothetical protein
LGKTIDKNIVDELGTTTTEVIPTTTVETTTTTTTQSSNVKVNTVKATTYEAKKTATKKKTTKKKKTKKKTTKKKASTKKVATASRGEYQAYAKSVGHYDDAQMSCLINLWNRESGWNPNSVNKSSGACGIPQAYPCSKIKKQQGSNDWKAQIRWGINYVNARYGSPCGA